MYNEKFVVSKILYTFANVKPSNLLENPETESKYSNSKHEQEVPFSTLVIIKYILEY